MSDWANLVHELGMLARIPRSGLSFLGSGHQTVAEHCHRVACIALILARRSEVSVDEARLVWLCLFHDFHESRIGDHNYVHRRYLRVDEEKLWADIRSASPLGETIVTAIQEFEGSNSPEACLARDADQIDLLALLREEADGGNPRAQEWMRCCLERVQTPEGRCLAKEVLATPADNWWFRDKLDPHWITGKG